MTVYLYLYLLGGQLKPFSTEAVVSFGPMRNPEIPVGYINLFEALAKLERVCA